MAAVASSSASPLPAVSEPWFRNLVRQSQQRNWNEGEACRALVTSYSALLSEVQTSREDKELLAGQVHQLREQVRQGYTSSSEHTDVTQRLAALHLENTQLRSEVDQWKQREQAHQATQQQLMEMDAALGAARQGATAATSAYTQLQSVYTEREQEAGLIKAHFELQQDNLEHTEAKLADALAQIEALKRDLRRAKKHQATSEK